MSDKRKILVQLDTDPQPSVFDRVVAVDAGVDVLFTHHGVKPDQVQALVHGAIFTRGAKDLKSTAVFVGGSDVAAGEAVLHAVRNSFVPQYGLSVSVMLDSNGSNTTAAAAVRAASKHMDLGQARALVLGGTGPVGQRVARLLARQGADVRIGSRSIDRAQAVAASIRAALPYARVEAAGATSPADGPKALEDRTLVIAAGAAGAVLLPGKARAAAKDLHLMIDLNAVPPAGIEGIEVTDKAVDRDGVICYGAIGVGDTKMKIHRAAVAQLFEKNDLVFDAEEIYDLALRL
jgi:methylenetetrahydrofolate/methylenetetrahydromethanopterin dehydrogenase (NADP+)